MMLPGGLVILSSRKDCFGVDYSTLSNECKVCLERAACSDAFFNALRDEMCWSR